MDGRKRTVQLKFRVTEAERDLILEKMKLIPMQIGDCEIKSVN